MKKLKLNSGIKPENSIDGKLLNEMADSFSDIIKNEKIYGIKAF